MVLLKEIQNTIAFCRSKAGDSIYPGGPTGTQYLEGLVRCKPDGINRGSYVEDLDTLEKTVGFIGHLDFKEVDVASEIQFGKCKYYQALVPDRTFAYCGVILLADARAMELPVMIRNGSHGIELFTRSSKSASLTKTNVISAIVEDGMLSTWYPGPFTANTPKEFPVDWDEWSGNWAVKIELPNLTVSP